MMCSAEEIEAKRRLAKQKLLDKRKLQSPQVNTPNLTTSPLKNSPVKSNNSNNYATRNLPLQPNPQFATSKNYSPLKINQVNNFQCNNTTNKPAFPLSSNSTHHNSSLSNTNYPSSSSSTSTFFKMKSPGRKSFQPYDRQPEINKSIQTPTFYGTNSNKISGTLSLLTAERFQVELSAYSPPATEIMRSCPSAIYDPKTRTWNFLLEEYDLLQNKMMSLRPSISIGKLPQFVLNCCREKKKESNYDLSSIDPELLGTLMPFQEEGVRFGIDKNGRCMIADDMGLGKTFQALGIANYYKADWPLLIVTTASMKKEWEEAIYNYIPSVPVMQIQYMVSAKDYINEAKILIVSHDLMSRSVDTLLKISYGVVIIDESHTLKNFKTKCTKAATALAKQAKRIILLSGTPALSRPSELYTQLSIIDDRFFGNFMDYSKRYCDGRTSTFGWDSSGQSNSRELEIILSKRFMIRRTKEDVLKSLPDKQQEVITLDVNLNQFSEEDRQGLLSLAAKYNTVNKKDQHAALLTFFSETAKIKIPSVCSYILQILERNEKFLVFAHHQKMLNAVEQVLIKKKKKFIRIDGGTSGDQRKYFVDQFQYNQDYVCAVLSITAANAGITLTSARLVLFAELHWNPSILSQAEARVHRIGQEGQVIIQYLIAPGTADDSIWRIIQEKQKRLQKIGLMRDSYENVSTKAQSKQCDKKITEGMSFTSVNTITSYFSPSPKKLKTETSSSNLSVEEEFFNDDFTDDMLSNVDIDF